MKRVLSSRGAPNTSTSLLRPRQLLSSSYVEKNLENFLQEYGTIVFSARGANPMYFGRLVSIKLFSIRVP